ncbi:MAG: hypothetical protein WD768_02130 [Phycisphaeraceae bacterium]
MSDIDLVIKSSKKLESMLTKLGAEGRGLHEKVSSLEKKLGQPLVRKLRFIATVRNKVVHEQDYEKIDDRRGFIDAVKEAKRELRALGGGSAGVKWKLWLALVILLAAAGAFAWWKWFA